MRTSNTFKITFWLQTSRVIEAYEQPKEQSGLGEKVR